MSPIILSLSQSQNFNRRSATVIIWAPEYYGRVDCEQGGKHLPETGELRHSGTNLSQGRCRVSGPWSFHLVIGHTCWTIDQLIKKSSKHSARAIVKPTPIPGIFADRCRVNLARPGPEDEFSRNTSDDECLRH